MAARFSRHKIGSIDSGHTRLCIVCPVPGFEYIKPSPHQGASRKFTIRLPELAELEAEPGAELKLARRVGVGDDPQASAYVGSRVLPIGPVEHVERIRLEHEARAFFGQPEALAQ